MILLLPSSQYIMISFYLVTSRNKDPVAASFKHVYKNSYESFLYFFYPFVVTQILLTVCKKKQKKQTAKNKRADNNSSIHEHFLLLRWQIWSKLSFLYYMVFFDNILLEQFTFKYQFSVVTLS